MSKESLMSKKPAHDKSFIRVSTENAELKAALESVVQGWGDNLDVISEEFDDDKPLTKERVEYYLEDFSQSDLVELLANALWEAHKGLKRER